MDDLRTKTALTEDQQSKLNFSLMSNIQRGDFQKVLKDINEGADVNHQASRHEASPLVEAALNNQIEMVDLLLQRGANINSMCTVFVPHEEFSERDSEEVNDEFYDRVLPTTNPLIAAVKENLIEMVTFLLDKGANVHVKDDYGNNVLIHAVHIEYEVNWDCQVDAHIDRMITLLMERGANPLDATNEGITPLANAIDANPEMHALMLDTLLKQAAKSNGDKVVDVASKSNSRMRI